MAISREEAIKSINTIIFTAMIVSEGKPSMLNMTSDEITLACKKAISDMEKLQKIEEVLKGWNSDNPRDVIHWEKIRMIEQIVKEVE